MINDLARACCGSFIWITLILHVVRDERLSMILMIFFFFFFSCDETAAELHFNQQGTKDAPKTPVFVVQRFTAVPPPVITDNFT